MSRLIMSCLLVGVLNGTLMAHSYSGGTGEPNDPYQIATAEDLIALGNEPNDYNDCFILTADIDLSGYEFDRAVVSPDTKISISYNGIAFTGCFDGQGHVIRNLSIDGSSYLGLFGYVGSEAVLSNLILESVDVNGSDFVGGLVGYLCEGQVDSVVVDGRIDGSRCVGGLVGGSRGGTLGLCCCNVSYVTGSSYIGGLVGGDGLAVRGGGGKGELIGVEGATVIVCSATGYVRGNSRVGGLIGNKEDGCIISSYSTAEVAGNNYVGGLVGILYESDIISNYSSGWVDGNEDTGGLVGNCDDDCVILNSFWDIEASGQESSEGGIGLTTVQMQDPNTYLSVGWDFVGEVANGIHNLWQMQGEGYPSFAVATEPNGSGILHDPYRITEANELGTVWRSPFAHYCLESDIDLSGTISSMPIVPWFRGVFDGNGYCVSHYRVDGTDCLGFFGRMLPESQVMNLCLETVDVNGAGDEIGALVGYNQGTVMSCYSSGKVNGKETVGGLVGRNGGEVFCCASACRVRGKEFIGGLVGSNFSIVSSSYSIGLVRAQGQSGSLAGSNSDSIMYCYSAAQIASNSSKGLIGFDWKRDEGVACFWDAEAAGIDSRYGLTTAEMLDVNTYLVSGWDFVGEANNGTEDLWFMPEGGYPELVSLQGIRRSSLEGEGTRACPYRVTNVDNLMAVREYPQACYILTTDLDLSGTTLNSAVVPWLSGVFDGNEHVIRELKINLYEYAKNIGLFGRLQADARVINLSVEGVDVNCVYQYMGFVYVGALVGYNAGGVISDCYSRIDINSRYGESIGGLVGYNDHGTIVSCSSESRFVGGETIGGLVGYNDHGIIRSCHSDSIIESGEGGVGGLVGFIKGGSVDRSYSVGSVNGYWYGVGGFVGINENGQIDICYSTSTVNGENSVGGLVGVNSTGTITSSYCTGDVSGEDYVGGLVGGNGGGSIASCYSTSHVSGENNVGGLIGSSSEVNITSCYSRGAVSGKYNVGGLIGYSKSNYVVLSHSNGDVSGDDYVGGWVGLSSGDVIMFSYSSGDVRGDCNVGGFIGNTGSTAVFSSYSHSLVCGRRDVGGLIGDLGDGATLQSCYSSGEILGEESVGGLVGDSDEATVISCFWDKNSSGQTESGVGIGLSTTEMKDINTYLNAGWDFENEIANGTRNLWCLEEGEYPTLKAPSDLEGSGTLVDPYKIADGNNLGMVCIYPQAHYRLMADLDLSGVNWDMAVVPQFGGVFDGNGHIIRNLHIEGNGYLGLFGTLMSEATVSCLGLENADVNGIGDLVASLVGCNKGRVVYCYVTGFVSGDDYVGSLVGYNCDSILSCYATANVCGNFLVGGLVGKNGGNVLSCYCTGAITFRESTDSRSRSSGVASRDYYWGGLIGYDTGTVASCFWDINTSGYIDSDGGTGLTTAEMQDINTYLDAGWDFVGETDNGTDDLWWMPEGDYPRLWWEE